MLRQIIKFVNNLMPRSYRNEHGFLLADIPAIISTATSIAGAVRGNKDKVENKWIQDPEYEESVGARKEWWKRLQDWGNDPNYGAITPDWSNIWDNVQRQVKQYYSGGLLTTGVRDKLKASLARRNMSDNPASDYLMMASGVEEANQMEDIATEMGKEKAELSEKGRMNWLNSLQNLQAVKPSGQWQSTVKRNPTNEILNAVGDVASTAAGYMYQQAQNKQSQDWMTKMMDRMQPQTTQGSISKTVSPSWLDTSKWRS